MWVEKIVNRRGTWALIHSGCPWCDLVDEHAHELNPRTCEPLTVVIPASELTVPI